MYSEYARSAPKNVKRNPLYLLSYSPLQDCEVWEMLCKKLLPHYALNDPYLLVDAPTWKAKLLAYKHSWNSDDCSR